MNLIDASLRALLIGAVAGSFVAIARWRGKPLAASFEHALWTYVLAGMLAFAVPKVTVHAGPPIADTMIESPALPQAVTVTPSGTHTVLIPATAQTFPIAVVWLIGASLMLLRILAGVVLTRRALAGARTILSESAVQPAITVHANLIGGVEESDNGTVPMTIGWPHARIVLPTAWRTWPVNKVRAVLAHEIAHVRRRDTLVTFLAAVNKAIFWFHPLAWWLDRRLKELAEFAADEAALKEVADPQEYAAVLIEVAALAQPSRLRWSSASVDFVQRGISRINRRVDRIFDPRVRAGSKKVIWAAAGVIAAITLVQFQRPVRAQEPTGRAATAPRPVFEVATIKPHAPNDPRMLFHTYPGGRFTTAGVTLKMLIGATYDLQDYQISEGPKWIESDRWDIVATTENGVNSQIAERVKALLEDRFKLAFHREKREMPVYDLVVAKGGPKFAEDDGECPGNPSGTLPPPTGPGQKTPCGRVFRGRNYFYGDKMHLVQILLALSNTLGRPVIDKTGLTGKYDIRLEWMPEQNQAQFVPGASHSQPTSQSSGPSIFTALQEQLGLKLESQKGPVEVLIIDRVEKPSEN